MSPLRRYVAKWLYRQSPNTKILDGSFSVLARNESEAWGKARARVTGNKMIIDVRRADEHRRTAEKNLADWAKRQPAKRERKS